MITHVMLRVAVRKLYGFLGKNVWHVKMTLMLKYVSSLKHAYPTDIAYF